MGAHGLPTVFLHVGAPKSGTTYVQSRLSADPPAAAAQGLLWPVPWSQQVKAAREVKRLREGESLSADGPWASLVRRVREWDGRSALVSMEWLMNAADHQVAAAVATLAPARVEVVCTARDLVRCVPAAWQESMQNFRTWPWDEYVRAIVDGDLAHPGAREFWSQQDVPAALRRWGTHVGLDRVHLVTVPPRGGASGVLWDRFCGVLGLDGAALPEPTGENPSLGAVSAGLMQRFNVSAKGRIPHQAYLRLVKHGLAKQVLAARRRSEPPIALADEVHAHLAGRAERMVAELREMPVPLVGDLDDLLPGAPETGGRDPSDVTEAELFQAALDGLVGTVLATVARDRRSARAREARAAAKSSGRPRRRPHRVLARRVAGFLSTRS